MSAWRRSTWLLAAGVAALALAAVGWQRPLPWLSDWARGLLLGIGAACLLAGLLLRFLPAACDGATPAQRRRYLREFLPPMLAYAVMVFASMWLLKRLPEPGLLRGLVAVLPVLPMLLALRAIVRHIRAIDELQQRIELESVSIATALVSLGYLTAGFLQIAKVIDVPADAAMIWVFPLVCFAYGIARAIVARRFH